MSLVISADSSLIAGEPKMTDSNNAVTGVGGSDVTCVQKSRAAFRTGKKLSKQEVVEEPYDSGTFPNVVAEDKDLSGNQKKNDKLSNKVESSVQNGSRQMSHRPVSSRPKLLIRSQALCAEDDLQCPVQRFNGTQPLGSTTRSSASSLSHDSSQDVYTDSTGIDLQFFIVNTLHKNVKDRQMLLQLEQQMKALINDSSRNSQRFPVMSSYNRMLVHRVAAFFGLDHNVDQSGTAVVVNKNSQTRIPNVEFGSLIRGDHFTDEPRKYLKRSVQSYEEGRHCLGSDLLPGRRAHSFDCEYGAATNAVQAPCPIPLNPVQVSMYPMPGTNSSSDIIGPQIMESPGTCYSYSEVQPIAVRTPLETNAIYGGFPVQPVYQWNTSENYTGYSGGADLPLITSVAPSSSRGAHLLGSSGNMKKAASIDTERSLHTNAPTQVSGPRVLRRSMTERHRPDLLAVREPSIPESTVTAAAPEPISVPTWHPPVFDATRVEPSSSNQYFIGPQCPRGRSYVQCVQTTIASPHSEVQCVTQQMDNLCVNEQPELASPQVFTYHFPSQCPNATFAQQASFDLRCFYRSVNLFRRLTLSVATLFLLQVQLPGSLCQTHPLFVPVLPQPALCRYGSMPGAAFLNTAGDYSPAPFVNYTEMHSVEVRAIERVPTATVEQL